MAVLARAVALALGLAFISTGCFSPKQPPCAFSCAADGLCPSGYTCADDGVCHRDDGQGTCDIPSQIDAAQDAASGDGDGAGDATD
jgi:hypothetical protein